MNSFIAKAPPTAHDALRSELDVLTANYQRLCSRLDGKCKTLEVRALSLPLWSYEGKNPSFVCEKTRQLCAWVAEVTKRKCRVGSATVSGSYLLDVEVLPSKYELKRKQVQLFNARLFNVSRPGCRFIEE